MTATPVVRTPRRKFGVWLATSLVVGNIVGSGIFMLPASLAPLRWNAVGAWVITGFGALSLAWVFSQLSRNLPEAGGSFGFMRAGLGEGPAFLGAWGYVVSLWAGVAAVTIAATSYLTRLIPAFSGSGIASPIAAVTIIWMLTAINFRGPKAAGGTQLVTVIIKLTPFIAVIALALYRLVSSGGTVLPPVDAKSFSLGGITSGVTLTLYAMTGLESAVIPADAVENPGRTIPIATMAGTALSAIVTVIATCSVALMLPMAEVAASKAPISDFIATSLGSVAAWPVTLCAVISCVGCINGLLFLSGELPATMSNRGALPRWFGQRNASGAAARPIALAGGIATALVLMAYTKTGVAAYNFAALVSTATNLVMYLFCVVAAMRFMGNGRIARSPGLVICAIGSILFVTWAFYGSGWEALIWGGALVLAGWPLYLLARRIARARVASGELAESPFAA